MLVNKCNGLRTFSGTQHFVLAVIVIRVLFHSHLPFGTKVFERITWKLYFLTSTPQLIQSDFDLSHHSILSCFSRANDHLLYIKSNGWFSVHLFLNVLLAFNFTGQFCPFETFLLHGFCLFFFRLFSLLCLPFTLPTPWVLLSFQLMFYNYKSLRGEGCIMISPRIFKFCIGGFNQQWMEMSM